ncbi:MAG: dephospho-CoA kinase [Peptoniphilus sp.]|uniref:dephospho-CoA kinase n=1 Tax=Peptoniphilus sp. TaxID=1971214 RepID=UPI002A74D0A7|nr:dephospho-CoA kinase [Peptoniphilus sp.]MDY2987254.1 dephospho-CoA kinase [Peptoniphilus sp.]
MTQSKVIVITGSIATGKSAVTEILRRHGFKVIDADEIAHEVLEKEFIAEKIRENFGDEFLLNGKVNRPALSDYVFKNKEKLEILNKIMHREIFKEINAKIQESEDKVLFVDMPLYFELKDKMLEYSFKADEVWLVYVKKDTQIKRLMNRDSISKEMAIKKINSQISVETKKVMSDIVVENDGSIAELEEKLEKLIKMYGQG